MVKTPTKDTPAPSQFDNNDLKVFARKYIWWKTPEDAIHFPQRVIAQVMSIGDYEDVQKLVSQVGKARLKETLISAQAGQFNERSWHYWHYRLGLVEPEPESVPPLPVRTFT